MTADEITTYMESLRDDRQREVLMRFFKTAPGEYGYGDEFLGIKVPRTREVVKLAAPDTPLSEIPELLMCRWHEVRLCGLLLLVWRFEKLATKRLVDDKEAILGRDRLLKLYLSHAEQANNWDLVDMTAPKILGHWLMLPSSLGDRSFKQDLVDSLADSHNLWKQRMSIVCTHSLAMLHGACAMPSATFNTPTTSCTKPWDGCCARWASACLPTCCATSSASTSTRCLAPPCATP